MQLRAAKTGRRLQRVIILHSPVSYAQWVEYDVKEMALKVREMIAEGSVVALDRIQVLEEDLSLRFKSLTSLYETGLIWDTDTSPYGGRK